MLYILSGCVFNLKIMDFRKMFANRQKQKLEVSYGYFVHRHHDLYGGLTYNGVFNSEEKAKEYADNQNGYDEINVLFLPYIEFEGKIFALWQGSACS